MFRYLERLTGHDAALEQLAGVRADLVRDLVPLAPDGLARSRRGGLLSSVVDDVDELQNLPLRVVLPLAVAVLTSLAAVVFTAIVSWPAAVVLFVCLAVAFAWRSSWAGPPAPAPSAPSPPSAPPSPTRCTTCSRTSTC